jgi:hypothetical protein
MSDWRNQVSEEYPYFGLGDLGEEPLEVVFRNDGEMTTTANGEAFKALVTVSNAPDGYEDMNGEAIESGKDYFLMSSSTRFLSQLPEVASDLDGHSVSITARGDGFDRTYSVEV